MPHVGLGGVPTPQDDASRARDQGDSAQYLQCQHALLSVRRQLDWRTPRGHVLWRGVAGVAG